MSLKEVDLTGGESVYCINRSQLKRAFDLVHANPASGAKINALLAQVEQDFDRNERAALSFILVDRLLKSRVK